MAETDSIPQILHTFFPPNHHGAFIEVGAARPDYLSMSAQLRHRHWRIISIEPNPIFCEAYRQAGFEILEYACGDRDADDVDFFVVDSHQAPYESGYVSFESFSSLGIRDAYQTLYQQTNHQAQRNIQTIAVKLRRLDTLLREYAPDLTEIDILSIDVEGWELEVLRGLSLEHYRPKVLLIENLKDTSTYVEFCAQRNYARWKRDAPNDIYIRSDYVGLTGC